jgi:hypothetical protein
VYLSTYLMSQTAVSWVLTFLPWAMTFLPLQSSELWPSSPWLRPQASAPHRPSSICQQNFGPRHKRLNMSTEIQGTHLWRRVVMSSLVRLLAEYQTIALGAATPLIYPPPLLEGSSWGRQEAEITGAGRRTEDLASAPKPGMSSRYNHARGMQRDARGGGGGGEKRERTKGS